MTTIIRMERTSTKAGAFTVAVSAKRLKELENENDVIIIWKRDKITTDIVNPITFEVS